MAATTKKNKSGPTAYTDYKKYPGPFSMNTKADKTARLTKGKSVPKLPKRYKNNPGM